MGVKEFESYGREENMSKIKRFEDIEAWKKTRQLVKEVYGISKTNIYEKDYFLID